MKKDLGTLALSAVTIIFQITAVVYADNIYVSCAGNGSIYALDSLGNASLFAPTFSGRPNHDIVFDSSGNLYAANYYHDSIVKYDQHGSGTFFSTGLKDPGGLIFDGAGHLYASCESRGTIVKIDKNGSWSVFASGLNQPSDLAFDEDGFLYVSCLGSDTIEKIDSLGNVSLFASLDEYIDALTYGKDGHLYVSTAYYNHAQIFKYDLNGNRAVFASNLSIVNGLIFDAAGNLYYADQLVNGSVHKLDSSGSESIVAAGLNGPLSIAIQIPEPAAILLFGLGAVLVAKRRR